MAKEKNTEESKVCSKNLLGAILKETSDDHYNFDSESPVRISSSSIQLDSLCKIYSGSVVRLAAKGAELGKTSQAFVFAENFMATMPKSKTFYIKCEARLSPDMKNRSGHKFVTSAEEWDYGTVFVYSGNVFETIAKTLETLLREMHKNGEHLCIIWDSLDHAILKGDLLKNVWDGKESPKVAGVPLLFKLLMKRFALPMEAYNGMLLVITQYTAEIKLDPYSKEPPRQNSGSGGNNLNHISSYTLNYLPRYGGDYILENPDEKPDTIKNKILGVYATVEITKSGSEATGAKVRIPIARNRVGCAIWKEKEIVDSLIFFSLLNKKGAWFSFAPALLEEMRASGLEVKEQLQGLNAVYKYIEDNKDVFKWLEEKLKFAV